MANTTDNLILEHLTKLRNEIRDLRRDVQNNFHDVKARLASLEAHNASHQTIMGTPPDRAR